MCNHQIIDGSSLIHLFVFGDPCLHPDFKEILSVLNKKNLFFAISTNASHPVYFNNDIDLSRLVFVKFSMPGFSQQSYDRIHGFNFERIKSNIENIVKNYRDNGFKGSFSMGYHLYQFNLFEISMAKEFAQRLNMGITVSAAFFIGLSIFKDYLTDNMGYATLKKTSAELITYHWNDILLKRPENHVCLHPSEALVLDEYCNVLACCQADRLCENRSLGNLFELSSDDIKEKKLKQRICSECSRLGIDFLLRNPLEFKV